MALATASLRILANIRNDATHKEKTTSLPRACRLADAESRSSKTSVLKALYRESSELESLGHTARGFFDMIRNRDAVAWPGWLESAMHSPLASFARRLERDRSAVDAALQLPWSNGMVEGQIHG
jgi:transposase